ncbi:unnamed protein product, partial [Polarella glacialis]
GRPAIAQRLQGVDFREYAMVTCYPGETRSRYLRHCDVSRGAVLTAIYYLNEDWNAEDGGCLRIFCDGKLQTRIKEDILPVANRLLLFWASDEVPHEVLATKRDRFTITLWFKRAAEAVQGPNFLTDLLLRHNPVSPLSMAAAVQAAGCAEGVVQQVQRLERLVHNMEEAAKVAILEPLVATICRQCGASAPEGAAGTDEFERHWFCLSCWHSWDQREGKK